MSAARVIVGQSDCEPMMMATTGAAFGFVEDRRGKGAPSIRKAHPYRAGRAGIKGRAEETPADWTGALNRRLLTQARATIIAL